jgi:2-keto-3-deoxy-L-rhamnonate aldolase RhmA
MRQRRTVKKRLTTQRALIGLLQIYPNSAFAELAGTCGYDFIILDGEHGVFSDRDYLQTLQVLSGVETLSIIRLPEHDTKALGRYMDLGVDAILVPNIATAEQARLMVRGMSYPPTGTRGFAAALHRGTRYGLDLDEHLQNPRNGVCLLVLVESALGVANIDEICKVEGVDGVIIGPADLAVDLGCPGDFSQAVYREAFAQVERAAKSHGKILGTVPHPGFPLDNLLATGHQLLILDADINLIKEAMVSQVTEATSCLQRN